VQNEQQEPNKDSCCVIEVKISQDDLGAMYDVLKWRNVDIYRTTLKKKLEVKMHYD